MRIIWNGICFSNPDEDKLKLTDFGKFVWSQGIWPEVAVLKVNPDNEAVAAWLRALADDLDRE